MTTTYGRITECNVTAPPRESGLTYTAALTVQIAAADLTRIDITRPIAIHQETPMTDQMIPADKVQEIATAMRDVMRRVEDDYPDGEFLMDMSDYIRDLNKLCARARPRPTLADMSVEERAACRWMQAEVEDGEPRAVIANPHWEVGSARVLWPGALIEQIGWEHVTPRPDLPRLEWPDTGQGADQDGEEVTKVDHVFVEGGGTEFGPWTFARIPKKADQ